MRNFGTFAIFFEKLEKNLISSLKFCQISNLKLDFFQLFQKKSRIFQNLANLFGLNFIWANFEQNQRHFFFEKKGLPSSRNLKKNSKIFPIFQLQVEIFSNFPKKSSNFPKFRKIIYPELHLSQFSANLEELFFSVTHSLSRYHGCRRGC